MLDLDREKVSWNHSGETHIPSPLMLTRISQGGWSPTPLDVRIDLGTSDLADVHIDNRATSACKDHNNL